VSTTPHETRLAEQLALLDMSQAELARRSRTSVSTIARAVKGEQIGAAGRAKIVAAMNAVRAEVQQPTLAASDIFPAG
jgi:transcriptional regulator with XRE-family HTH domain